MPDVIIAQGAEAVLIKKQNTLIKNRIKKSYRHPELDKTIRHGRTRRESKIMQKLANTINVPKIIKTEQDKIEMQFINGKLLSQYLESFSKQEQKDIAKKMAQEISRLHEKDIIHGDLTTSNMIWKDKQIYFIDFGLAFHSARSEDKAVDIHLLKQALDSKHYKISESFFKNFIKEYSKHASKETITRLEKVESRGRYKGKSKNKKPKT